MTVRYARNLLRIAMGMPPEAVATFTLVRDIDAIKLAVASNAAAQSYTGAALDGALANPGPAVPALPMTVSLTTSAAAGSYHIVDPVVFTGLDEYGVAQTEEIMLTQVNGNEFLVGTKSFSSITQIDIPAQHDGAGQFEFGVEDILPGLSATLREHIAGNNGNLGLQNTDGTTAVIPINAANPPLAAGAQRVLGATTTCVPLTIGYDYCTQSA